MPLSLPPSISKNNAHGGKDTLTFALAQPEDRDGDGTKAEQVVWMSVRSTNADGTERGAVSLGAWATDLAQAVAIMAKAAE